MEAFFPRRRIGGSILFADAQELKIRRQVAEGLAAVDDLSVSQMGSAAKEFPEFQTILSRSAVIQESAMDLEIAYDAYAAQLYRHALAITGQQADAEDVVQSVFVKLARRRRQSPIADLEAYLHAAVRRTAHDSVTRRRAWDRWLQRQSTPGAELGLVVANNGAPPDETESLNRALARLPPEQREVVLLHVYEGKTFRRIGELLAISPDTASSRYRYAREKLKEWLHGLE